MRSLLLALAPVVLASPVLHRRYDLDGNGVPDWCKEIGQGKAECMMANNVWTTIPSTISASQAPSAAASGVENAPAHAATGRPKKSDPAGNDDSKSSPVPSKAATPSSTASLPDDVNQWRKDKGTRWTMELLPGTNASQALGEGSIYSSTVNRLGWDKGRTSSIDGKVFWNFGDCMSVDGLEKGAAAGFSMGAAFYGSVDKPLEVVMTGMSTVSGNDFAKPWTGTPNPDPVPPKDLGYGMDTSNVAQVAPGKGIGFAWEIWRGNGQADARDIGNAMFEVTLGPEKPIATRQRDLITDSSKIQIGLMTVFNPNIDNTPGADGYLYMYTPGAGTWDSVIVGRAPVAQAFDPTQYQFMKLDGTWDHAGVIPAHGDTAYGMAGKPVSNSQGSVMWNAHLGKYLLFCGTLGASASFHTADKPWGPWSQPYWLLDSTDGVMRYGANVHPALLPANSDGSELLFSWGSAAVQTMYKITFKY